MAPFCPSRGFIPDLGGWGFPVPFYFVRRSEDSLRSKRFRASLSRKLEREQKKEWRGRGRGLFRGRCSRIASSAIKLACVASVSNQVTEQKLEREQKKKLVPTFSTNTRGNACYAGYHKTPKPDRYGSKWNHRPPRLTISATHGFRTKMGRSLGLEIC